MENVAPSPKRARTEATIDDVQPPLPELADAALVSKLLSGSFSPTTAEEQCDAINKLREAINALRARLSKHNVDVSDDESELTIAASPEKDEKAAWLEQVEKDGLVLGNVDDLDPSEWQVPNQCIPVHVNVTLYDWTRLIEATKFDVIMMDPPWQLATANPTRGVALGYSQLTDEDIKNLPINSLQTEGYLLIWVINAKYKLSIDMFQKWGYDIVDEIVWVKSTVNRRLAKSHGYYLQHAKEVCLVGKKRTDPKNPPTYSKEPTIVYTTVPLEDENEEGEKAAQQQQEEEEEAQREAVEAERAAQLEEDRKAAEFAESDNDAPPEPATGPRVALRLLNGSRVVRRFSADDTLLEIRRWARRALRDAGCVPDGAWSVKGEGDMFPTSRDELKASTVAQHGVGGSVLNIVRL
mmetsp:Transcript_3197/g.8630  ORF Transcript_3197/g.8630 Transcript_3197/m.8630 type:complete len:410 (-) Transcript_3197:35-1264(-)